MRRKRKGSRRLWMLVVGLVLHTHMHMHRYAHVHTQPHSYSSTIIIFDFSSLFQHPPPGEIGATASYQAFDSAPPASHPRKSIKRQRTISSSITPGTNLYKAYRLSQYLYFKARQLTVAFIRLFWRFLELHLHKIISLTLFVVAISQVSACYWILLVLLIVVVVPLPALNPLTYPLVTLYLGFLIGTKMVYQVPIIHSNWLEIDDNCTGEVS